VLLQLEEGSDDAESRVDEDAGLGDDEQEVVQLQLSRGVVPEYPDLGSCIIL